MVSIGRDGGRPEVEGVALTEKDRTIRPVLWLGPKRVVNVVSLPVCRTYKEKRMRWEFGYFSVIFFAVQARANPHSLTMGKCAFQLENSDTQSNK